MAVTSVINFEMKPYGAKRHWMHLRSLVEGKGTEGLLVLTTILSIQLIELNEFLEFSFSSKVLVSFYE